MPLTSHFCVANVEIVPQPTYSAEVARPHLPHNMTEYQHPYHSGLPSLPPNLGDGNHLQYVQYAKIFAAPHPNATSQAEQNCSLDSPQTCQSSDNSTCLAPALYQQRYGFPGQYLDGPNCQPPLYSMLGDRQSGLLSRQDPLAHHGRGLSIFHQHTSSPCTHAQGALTQAAPDLDGEASASAAKGFPKPIPVGAAIPTLLHGPPQKPRQSGHALWVGNLPPGTTVDQLKDHFSRDATLDILSVFLISKTNCAFVNYSTESACAAALSRFNASRFHETRLLCRLRRSSGADITASSPLALLPSFQPKSIPTQLETSELQTRDPTTPSLEGQHTGKIREKYFIMKSLTIRDLINSVAQGMWVTQTKNEGTLNRAFKVHKCWPLSMSSANPRKGFGNVYLIFSANKSGEYFGYARMASSIFDGCSTEPNHDLGTKATVKVEDHDFPTFVATPATDHAPSGRIVDDSTRGTIFWEADVGPQSSLRSVPDNLEGRHSETDETAKGVPGQARSAPVMKAYGNPFKIEWLATDRLPFHWTRGLRNPWNAHKEIKIARDGTELETSVGRRLIQMFHDFNNAPSYSM